MYNWDTLSRPGFYNPVSEGIRRANPVLVTNYFKEKVLLKMVKCLKWQNVMFLKKKIKENK